MKLVFLGDIHANLPALEAALKEIRKKKVDGLFHLGDVVGYGPQPRQVIARLRAEGIEGVRGNHDERVATGAAVPVGQSSDEAGLTARSCDWTRRQLSYDDLDWLQRQPFIRTIDTGQMKVAFCHATPVDMTTPPHDRQPDDFFREMASYTGADVHVFAHTHVPFWRVVDGVWFVNAGSVGLLRPGEGRLSYASIELNGGAQTRVVHLPYDVRLVAQAVRDAALPEGVLGLLGAE